MQNGDIAKIDRIGASPRMFRLRWKVTSLCNYACDFCIQGTRKAHIEAAKGESRELRSHICGAIIEQIEALEGFDRIDLSLIGGEVCMLDDFPDLLGRLAACRFPGDIVFGITTNLSMPGETYCSLCEIAKRHDRPGRRRILHIGASFYRAYTTWDDFSAKLIGISRREIAWPHFAILKDARRLRERLLPHPIRLSATIPLLSDEDYALLVDARDSMLEHRIAIAPTIIRKYPTELSAENLEKVIAEESPSILATCSNGTVRTFNSIQVLGASLDDTETFCPRGYLCDAGVSSIDIGSFGNVQRCPTLGGTMHLGSLLDGTYTRLTCPQPCTSDHCSCNFFGHINRER